MEEKFFIRVPKDKKAMEDYYYGMEKEEQMEEWVLSKEQLNTFWHMGVLDEINVECDIIIDLYEEERLFLDKIPIALEVVDQFISTNSNEELIKLREMLKLAMEYKTLVGFDF